ncbi:hypothetical protein RND71_012271 [Anisodus tanguticus]|uniref:Uncharacterized protein n=1 Tax=Anisodus tanguticus TaxID=243964 RepID=A0AAE1SFD6_9SOLA|nr:hypothetical protein RND71_012271 [Anisodus tanguticus]
MALLCTILETNQSGATSLAIHLCSRLNTKIMQLMAKHLIVNQVITIIGDFMPPHDDGKPGQQGRGRGVRGRYNNTTQTFHLDFSYTFYFAKRISSALDNTLLDSHFFIKQGRNNVNTARDGLPNWATGHYRFGPLPTALSGHRFCIPDLGAMKLRSVNDFLSGLSHSHSLVLENQGVEILSKNNHLAGISLRPFTKLRSLELHTGFHKHNIPGLANLFRSSPATNTLILKITTRHNIQRRHIQVQHKLSRVRKWDRDLWQLSNSGEERFWESQSNAMNSFLKHLKVVKIHGFSDVTWEVSRDDRCFKRPLLKASEAATVLLPERGTKEQKQSIQDAAAICLRMQQFNPKKAVTIRPKDSDSKPNVAAVLKSQVQQQLALQMQE